MRCIHHLIKFTPNLATLSEPLRPLLSKATLKAINENRLFDVNCSTRVRCGASKKGIGA